MGDFDCSGCDLGGCDCGGADCDTCDCGQCDCCCFDCECSDLGCCCERCACDDRNCGRWMETWQEGPCEGCCNCCGVCVRDCCFDCRNVWCQVPLLEIHESCEEDCYCSGEDNCDCSGDRCNLGQGRCCGQPCGYWCVCHCYSCDPWCTWPTSSYHGCDCHCCTQCSKRRTCRCCSHDNRCESEVSVKAKDGSVIDKQPTADGAVTVSAVTTQPV